MNSHNFEPNIMANSTLNIRASGSINDEAIQDLFLDNGKSIAELINDQKEKDQKNDQKQNNE